MSLVWRAILLASGCKFRVEGRSLFSRSIFLIWEFMGFAYCGELAKEASANAEILNHRRKSGETQGRKRLLVVCAAKGVLRAI